MLRYPGRLLAPGEFVPPAVVDFIGRQLDLAGDELADYACPVPRPGASILPNYACNGFRSFSGGAAHELGKPVLGGPLPPASAGGHPRGSPWSPPRAHGRSCPTIPAEAGCGPRQRVMARRELKTNEWITVIAGSPTVAPQHRAAAIASRETARAK